MARISFSNNGNTLYEKLLGHNSDILESWIQLETTFLTKTSLPAELLEQVRRNLAFDNQCEYCMAKGKPDSIQDSRISLAVAFAKAFLEDHIGISDEQFKILKDEFSDREISELCSFISFISASQKFGAVMRLYPESKE